MRRRNAAALPRAGQGFALRASAAALAALGSLFLTACGSPRVITVTSELTLEQAKRQTQQTEREIAAFVPPEAVGATEHNEQGYLWSCREEGSYKWMGYFRVTYSAPVDIRTVLNQIAAEFRSRGQYEIRESIHDDGSPRLQIIGAFGEDYLVDENKAATSLEVTSYSPCFVLPEGAWPGSAF